MTAHETALAEVKRALEFYANEYRIEDNGNRARRALALLSTLSPEPATPDADGWIAYNDPQFTDKPPYCNTICFITKADAILYRRRVNPDFTGSDADALADFMAVGWAWEVEAPNTNAATPPEAYSSEGVPHQVGEKSVEDKLWLLRDSIVPLAAKADDLEVVTQMLRANWATPEIAAKLVVHALDIPWREAEAAERQREACAKLVENRCPATQDMLSTEVCDALDSAAAAIRSQPAAKAQGGGG